MNKKRMCIGRMPLGLAKFITKSRNIQNNLSNPLFNTVTPTPAEVLPLIEQLAVYEARIELKDHSVTGPCKALVKQVKAMLAQQATCVNAIADGNIDILSIPGFELNKIPVNKAIPDYGVIMNISTTFDGQAIVVCKTLEFAERYEFEFSGAGGFHRDEESYHTKLKISDLPSDVEIKVRARGINRRGVGDWGPSMSFKIGGSTQTANEE